MAERVKTNRVGENPFLVLFIPQQIESELAWDQTQNYVNSNNYIFVMFLRFNKKSANFSPFFILPPRLLNITGRTQVPPSSQKAVQILGSWNAVLSFVFYKTIPQKIKLYQYTCICNGIKRTSEVHINAARNAESHAEVTTEFTES